MAGYLIICTVVGVTSMCEQVAPVALRRFSRGQFELSAETGGHPGHRGVAAGGVLHDQGHVTVTAGRR
ncbi:MAG: hypothetical protein ACKVWR_18530 [Acidimicrobiales bacterium]